MIQLVDSALNRITMYRLALYYVAGLLLVAFGFGFAGLVPNDPTALTFSAAVILGVCWGANRLFATLLRVPANTESIYITAFILALVLPPTTAANLPGVAGLVLASFVAIASKFVLAIRHRHIFNPVAIGIAVSGLALDQPATWWVGGNLPLAPFVVIGGLIVVRKVQRFDMVGVYLLVNLSVTLAASRFGQYGEALTQSLLYSPLLFAGFAMLTEPLTSPHARGPRLVYGAIVGALSSPNVHIMGFYFSPEIAFLVGNIFAWTVSPKGRFKLTLVGVEEMAADCYDFIFVQPQGGVSFRPISRLDSRRRRSRQSRQPTAVHHRFGPDRERDSTWGEILSRGQRVQARVGENAAGRCHLRLPPCRGVLAACHRFSKGRAS